MKIAFVGNYQYHCGSSNALLGYVNAGKALGHDVRVSEFGSIDKIIRKNIPIAKRLWKADLLIVVYESYPFLSNKDLDEIKKQIPRSKRLIIDPDCKYAKPVVAGGDSNHSNSKSYDYWTKLYDDLSDTILQPTLKKISGNNVHQFLYFGINPILTNKNIKKEFDFLYVGNNWYRWSDIYKFIKSTSSIRDKLKKIAIIGRYWDKEVMKGYEEATYSDPNFLKTNKIELIKSTLYGSVEQSMSKGLISPIFIRPILNKLKLVTPRMFETFSANTVVILPEYFKHAAKLYGEKESELKIPKQPNDKIADILNNYKKYSNLCKDIRENLNKLHSYETRLNELIKFI